MWPGMKAIESNQNLSDFLKDYRYQPELTGRLDRLDSQPFLSNQPTTEVERIF
jgi:hypothetical protein